MQLGKVDIKGFGMNNGSWCSVIRIGALTSKTYSFGLRKWDLQCVESCDIYDDIYSSIRVESFGLRIIRVSPVVEGGLSEEWITNVVRFGLDGLLVRRLGVPVGRVDGVLVSMSWFNAMRKIFFMIEVMDMKCNMIRGSDTDGESILICKEIEVKLEGSVDLMSMDGRFEYINENMFDFEFVVLMNIDLRRESPILEMIVRLRGSDLCGFWRDGESDMESSTKGICEFLKGMSLACCRVMSEEKSLVIYGYEEGAEDERSSVRGLCNDIRRVLYVYNKVYGKGMNYEIGGLNEFRGSLVYNIGNEFVDYGNLKYLVYQGTHMMHGARYGDVVLPSGTFLESEGSYLNSFGDIKVTKLVFDVPGMCRKGWRILMFMRDMISFDGEGGEGLLEIRRRIYESTTLGSSVGYKFRVIEVISCSWLWMKSYYRYDLFVKSYYDKSVLRRISRVIGLASSMDDLFNWYE